MKLLVSLVDDAGVTLESHTSSHLRPSNIAFDTPHADPATKLRIKGFVLTPIVEQISEPGPILELAEQDLEPASSHRN
jgi:hypothetical protein